MIQAWKERIKKIGQLNFKAVFIRPKEKGMTLIEALVGIALVAIAVLGLAQLFTFGILMNSRADRIANATFLAQQQIEFLRNLTGTELSSLSGNDLDEQIDVNSDGTYDYRRLTVLNPQVSYTEIRVLVFGPAQVDVDQGDLLDNPVQQRVMADIRTILAR